MGVISTTETGWEGGGGAVSRVVYDVPFFPLLGQPPYGCSGNASEVSSISNKQPAWKHTIYLQEKDEVI